MRVCLVSEQLSTLYLAFNKALGASKDFEFSAVYFDVLPSLEPEIPHQYVNLHGRQLWRTGYLLTGVVEACRWMKPDLIVVGSYTIPDNQLLMWHSSLRGTAWALWAERPGMRTDALSRLTRGVLLRPIARHSSGVLAIGSLAVSAYTKLLNGRAPVLDVPYHIELGEFQKIPRDGLQGYGLRFLYVGQLIPRKGVDVLLSAFAAVAREYPTARLTIVGGGPLRGALEASLDSWTRPRVCFAGHQRWSDLPAYYAQSDVFCFPSNHDGWGLTVYEAMASGMPVVATSAIGAAVDLVEDDVSGYVVPPGKPEEFAKRMMGFAGSPDSVAFMGRNARDKMDEYSLAAGVERFRSACEKILGSR